MKAKPIGLWPCVPVIALVLIGCAREPREVDPVAVTVLGHAIHESALLEDDGLDTCARWRPVTDRIHSDLMGWLIADHRLEPTRSEVDAYIHYVHVQPMQMRMPDMELPDDWIDEHPELIEQATHDLRTWKIQNTLYDLYGGRVAVDPTGLAGMAWEAYDRFLSDSERQGRLQFHSDSYRELVWRCLLQGHAFVPDNHQLSESAESVAALRAHPGTRHVRALVEQLSRFLGDDWLDVMERMEHPSGWQ